MLLSDRLYLALLWLRWRHSHRRWFFVRRMKWDSRLSPRGVRAATKLEAIAWRRAITHLSRFEREERRILQVR